MNWHDRDFFEPQYFTDIKDALKQHAFLHKDSAYSNTEQIGHWIVDRVDQVLAVYNHLDKLPLIAEKAMDAFEWAAEHFPEDIARHFINNAGVSSFKGLFSTRQLDVYAMWARIAQRTHSNWHTEDTWLHKLACTLLRDCEFSIKLDEAAECCKLGMSRRDTLSRIEHHHQALDSPITSAKSLLMLDLL